MSTAQAKAILGEKFPKPAPRCKHRWRKVVSVWKGQALGPTLAKPEKETRWWKECDLCGKKRSATAPKEIKRTPLKPSRTPIAQMTAERRRRVNGWSAIREAIRVRDESVCYWCGIVHADRGATAEHPYPRVHAQEDKETGLLWVGSWSCHRAKEQVSIRGQIKGLRILAEKYPPAKGGAPVPEQTNDVIERNWLVVALRGVQRDIDAGVRASLLPKAG